MCCPFKSRNEQTSLHHLKIETFYAIFKHCFLCVLKRNTNDNNDDVVVNEK